MEDKDKDVEVPDQPEIVCEIPVVTAQGLKASVSAVSAPLKEDGEDLGSR